MTWLAPEAFAWAGLAALLILFYLLRPRRQKITVSSLFLWRRDAEDGTGSTFWQALKRWLLILLQLLVLAALVVVLARPVWPSPERARPDLVLVIDASARMGLPADAGTPMDLTLGGAREFVDSSGGDAAISIILATESPSLALLRETDRGQADQTLRDLRAGGSAADMSAALALAQTVLAAGPGGSIAVFSDAAFHIDDDRLMRRAGLIAAGDPSANIGLVTVERRRDRNGAVQVLATVGSNLKEPAGVSLVSLDGELEIDARTLDVPPKGRVVAVVDVPPGADVDRVVIRDTGLPIDGDDQAFLTPDSYRPLQVQIVASNPRSYERALSSSENLGTSSVEPAAYVEPADQDLLIFVGFVPDVLPAASVILIAPPPGNPLFPYDPSAGGSGVLPVRDSELTDSVDFGFLQSYRPPGLPVPGWATVDLFVGDGAGIFHGIWQERRVVVIGFDPESTGMDQLPAFPILLRNSTTWANPLIAVQSSDSIRPGRVVEIRPHPRATRLVVVGPTGEVFVELDRPFAATLPALTDAGLYQLRQYADDDLVAEETFGVAPAFESVDPRPPRPGPPPLPTVVAERHLRTFEAWPWFAALALLLMAGEWTWFHRSRAASR